MSNVIHSLKKFFAPCMGLLTWEELKDSLQSSYRLSRQTFGLYRELFWWGLISLGIASNIFNGGKFSIPLSIGLGDFETNYLVGMIRLFSRDFSLNMFFSLEAVLKICACALAFFFFISKFILLRFVCDEIEDVFALFKRYYHAWVVALFAFVRIPFFGIFLDHILFFFYGSEPSWKNLSRAVRNSLRLFVRFFPPLVATYLLAIPLCLLIICFCLGWYFLGVAIFSNTSALFIFLKIVFVMASIAEALPFLWQLIFYGTMFFEVLSSVLYNKITLRYSELFADKTA